MSKKALAAVVEKFGEPLVMKEIDIPEIKPGQVLIRILVSGICGSDVHIWEGKDARSKLPMILGHESIGFIEKMGSEKTDIFGVSLKQGDLVAWNRGVSCKNCYQCQINRKNHLCYHRWVYGISKSINEYPYLNGGYCTHMILDPKTEIIKLCNNEDSQKEDYVSYVSACCAGTTTSAIYEQIDMSEGKTVLIQGPGSIGAFCVAFAKEHGASKIIVIGGTPKRLDICKEAGAHYIIDRKATTPEERLQMVMDITNGFGVDYVLEVAGRNEAIEEGLDYLGTNGTYATTLSTDTGTVPVKWFKNIARKNARIQGAWAGDIKNTWEALEVYKKHKNVLKKLVTHRFKLEEANEALLSMKNREAIKAVLTP